MTNGLAAIVLGGVLSLGAALLVRRRAHRRAAHRLAPPDRPGPLTIERVEGGIRQSAHRAFSAWWHGLRQRCPGCGADTLGNERSGTQHVSIAGGGGFTACTVTLACGACGWSIRFPHTDAGPRDPIALAPAPHLCPEYQGGAAVVLKKGTPVRWRIASAGGEALGEVVANGAGGWEAGDAAGSPDARATLAIARVLIAGATAVETDPMTPEQATAALTGVVHRQLLAYGGRVSGWVV